MQRKKRLSVRLILLFVFCLIAGAALFIARPEAAWPEPQVAKSQPSSADTDPKKGSIKLDLQVDEDSSVFTKTVMVKLENLDAAEVEPFVRKSLSTYGAVSVNSQANILVITDREPKLSDLVNFVKEMDKLGIEGFVQLETEVIKLNTVQASSLMIIVRDRLSAEGMVQADDNLNVLIITDVRGKIEYVKDIISQLDLAPQQIIIEAKIVNIYDTDFSDVGIDIPALLNRGNISVSTRKISQKDWGGDYNDDPDTYSERTKTTYLTEASTADQIINVLVGTGRASLVANTTIVTLNNKRGAIYRQTQSDRTSSISSDLLLEATPHIGAGNLITIELKVSAEPMTVPSTTSTSLTQMSTSLPKRSLESTIIMNEGETFVVGGFEFSYISKIKRKTPILGSIPIIGEIFSKKVDYEYINQVLFFITPRIVENQSNPPSEKEKGLMEEQ